MIKAQISNLIEIRLVEAELHEDGRTDGQTRRTNSSVSQFYERTKKMWLPCVKWYHYFRGSRIQSLNSPDCYVTLRLSYVAGFWTEMSNINRVPSQWSASSYTSLIPAGITLERGGQSIDLNHAKAWSTTSAAILQPVVLAPSTCAAGRLALVCVSYFDMVSKQNLM